MATTAIPLSRTKIVVPARRAEILSRPRLLELLYDLLDKKLILISAPAGYGKTSLLIDLAHAVEMPLCWLSLDALDQDPQRFIAYFIASLSQRFPQFGGQSVAALNNLASLEQDGERLIVTLTNEIYEQIHEHFVLALDDYHLVDGVPAIRSFVSRFVQLAGENCHLILSSRTLISLPDLPLMIAHDQVGGLDFLELTFRVEEIQDLFARNYHQNISKNMAEELARATEGWVTGLQLSNLAVAQSMADRLRVARTSGVGLFDYLGQQVLDQQSPELREFLLFSSLLDEFDAGLCAAVLGPLIPEPRDWQGLIDSVLRNNLFVLPVGAEGKWLRYHHLFQDFLQARLREKHPGQVNPILHRLAEVYEQRGEWEKAHHVYRQLGDLEALAGLIERAGPILLHNDRLITLSSWLEYLPETLVRDRPILLALRGSSACMAGEVHYGLSLLDEAKAAFRARENIYNLALVLARCATAHRYLGNYSAAIADAEEALNLTTADNAFQIIRAEAQRVKGLILYRLGQARQAIECLENSLAAYTRLDEQRSIPILLMELGMAYRATGNYDTARVSYEKALAIWQREDNMTWQANLLNNLGGLHHALGEYEQAALAFENGLQCARRSGYIRMEALILTSMGDLYLELGELDGAQQAYSQAQGIAQRIGDRFLIFYSIFAQAGWGRLRKDFAQAYSILNQARTMVEISGSAYEQGLYHLENGRLLLTEGEVQQAILDFQASNRYFEQGGQRVERAWSQLWLAAACNAAGDTDSAHAQLQSLTKDLIDLGQAGHSLYVAVHHARTWLASLQNDPQVGLALSQLFEKADQWQNDLPTVRASLRRITDTLPVSPPRLIIQALGREQVKVNGKLVTTSDWQTQAARDLFFYFLSASQPVTKEQVGVAFWPDISPAQLKMRFKINIYRLRHALGQEAVLFEDDHYRFNRALDYEYDVETFESCLAQASASQDVQERITHYQTAVELVQGPYLADMDADWALPERERLSQAYLSALLSLAEIYLENGETEKALQICQRALAWDPCSEAAHCLAMRCHAARGDRPAVARQYQQCRETLLAELELPPSPETEALYRQLTA